MSEKIFENKEISEEDFKNFVESNLPFQNVNSQIENNYQKNKKDDQKEQADVMAEIEKCVKLLNVEFTTNKFNNLLLFDQNFTSAIEDVQVIGNPATCPPDGHHETMLHGMALSTIEDYFPRTLSEDSRIKIWPVTVFKVDSTTAVWGRFLEKKKDGFIDPGIELSNNMGNYYKKNNHPAEEIKMYSFYAVEYKNTWYRIRIYDFDEETGTAIIYFLDTGECNEIVYPILYQLTEQFTALSPMAVKITINNLEGLSGTIAIKQIVEQILLSIQNMFVEALNYQITSSAEKLKVVSGVIWNNGLNINEHIWRNIINYCKQHQFRVNTDILVKLSNIDKHGNIHVVAINDRLIIIYEMISMIINSERFKELANTKIYDKKFMYLCNHSDKKWARVEILQVIDKNYVKVNAIDYGRTIKVKKDTLRRLNFVNNDIIHFPPQASIVQLDGIVKFNYSMQKQLREIGEKNDTMNCTIIGNKKIPIVKLTIENNNHKFSINSELNKLDDNVHYDEEELYDKEWMMKTKFEDVFCESDDAEVTVAALREIEKLNEASASVVIEHELENTYQCNNCNDQLFNQEDWNEHLLIADH